MTMSPGDPAKTLTQLVATEIKVEMARQDLRQSQLARKMGVTEQWLSVRLRGRQPIDLNDLARIAHALGVEVHRLLPEPEVANTLWNPPPADRPRSEPVSPDRPPRGPRRERTRPGRTTPREDTRRPGWFPRPVPA